MARRIRASRLILAVVCTLLLAASGLLAASSPAMATVSISVLADGQLILVARDARPNVVAVRPRGFDYAVYAEDDEVVAGTGCERSEPGVFVCGPLLSSVTYIGGPANDYVDLSEVALRVTAYTGAGFDLIEAGSAGSVADGGPGRDALLGGAGIDRADGGRSGDVLNGGGGSDTMLGGAGNDLLESGEGLGNVLVGGPGTDALRATSPLDVVVEGSGFIDGSAARAALEADAALRSLLGAWRDRGTAATHRKPTASVSVPGSARKVVVLIRQHHRKPLWTTACITPFRGATRLTPFSKRVRTRVSWPVKDDRLSPLAQTASARRGRCR